MFAQVPTLPETPKVSTFAPAEDLANQVEQYLGNLEKYVADEDSYKEATENEKIGKEENTLVILAWPLVSTTKRISSGPTRGDDEGRPGFSCNEGFCVS